MNIKLCKYAVKPKLLFFFLCLLELVLDDGEAEIILTSLDVERSESSNVYALLDIQVPKEFGLSVTFHTFGTHPMQLEEGLSYFYFGDGIDRFTTLSESCNFWQLVDDLYQTSFFSSRSSSAKLIFTSNAWGNNSRFQLQFVPVRTQNNLTSLAGEFK